MSVLLLLLSACISFATGLEDANASCDIAVVGAGVGGAYAAWRAAKAGKKVCIFEMSNRPGGRIHSLRNMGPKKDLVVEAGAYRFTASNVCNKNLHWCINTPIIRSIVKELDIASAVYDPDPTAWDHEMRKIVDQDGNDAGYLTLPESLISSAVASGASLHYNSKVVGLFADDEPLNAPVQVRLASGAVVNATSVLLNIPQRPLLELLRRSSSPFSKVYTEPLYTPTSFDIMKLYVHYEDAWWRNDLGLKSGPFRNHNPPPAGTEQRESPFDFQILQTPAPLKGQYHDGNVRCDLPDGRCRGYLQVYYANAAISFYQPYHATHGDAAMEFKASNSAEQAHLLKSIHEALVDFHRKQLDAINATERVSSMMPDSGVLSIWSASVDGIAAGCHVPKTGKHPLPSDLTTAALQPFPGRPVYVANEAYGPLNCWAEGSLNMSHRALELLQVPLPKVPGLFADSPYPSPMTDPFLMHAEIPPPAADLIVV